MAIEALLLPSKFLHEPRHDLESLFYVILAVCSYMTGPGWLRSPIPMEHELSIPMNEWWDTNDRHLIARAKALAMSAFEECVLNRLPDYWKDFHDVLFALRNAIWKESSVVLIQPNVATHDAFLKILVEARDRYRHSKEPATEYAELNSTPAGTKRKECGEDDQGIGKVARGEGNQRFVTFKVPAHNPNPGPLSCYVDSGAQV